MPNLIDITGQRFGRLTVIRRHDLWHGSARWECKCDCGKQSYITGSALRSGHSKSCGCLNREISSNHHKTHGQSHANRHAASKAYRSWNAMIQRCENKKNTHYKTYGGRGITVCNEWHDFATFHRDMGDCPDGMTIDRIDCNGNYEPGNCRWADRRTQQNNLRSNVLITFNGKTQTISYWADEIGISYSCLDARIRRGWSVDRALTEKPQKKTRYEPGTDSDEQPWYRGGWCVTTSTEGRGD